MAKKRYSITDKMKTIWLLRDNDVRKASEISGVPVGTIKKWQKNYDQIKAEFFKYEHDEGIYKLIISQNRMADKIGDLTNAITTQKIESAPLNQLSSAIGVLVDRFLRIHDAKEIEESDNDNRYIIEYYDADTGEITETPPWAGDDSEDESALHSSFLWQKIRENGTGEAGSNGNGVTGDEGLVARTHLSDGESGLARFEERDGERDWHPD